jgi:hypothetical protein
MNIVLINGTEVKGCTYHLKNIFLDVLREGNNIEEFYLPKDCPYFCCGCKTCFIGAGKPYSDRLTEHRFCEFRRTAGVDYHVSDQILAITLILQASHRVSLSR